MFKIHGMVTVLFSLFLGSTSGLAETETHQMEKARFVMGTLARIEVFAADSLSANEAIEAGFQTLDNMESIFSTWTTDSELSFVNSVAGTRPVSVSPHLGNVLQTSLDLARLSEGAFDPTVLPLVRLWGFRESEPTRPSDEAITQCLQGVGYDLILWDPHRHQVQYSHSATQLDFGGVAKGYALDQAAERMLLKGATGGLIDLGGGLMIFGEGAGQIVGIYNPDKPDEPFASLEVTTGSVATSGQYENFHEDNLGTWGHILDARTGQPSQGLMSVTVLSSSAMWADVLSTAVFVLGPEKGLALLNQIQGCEGVLVVGGISAPAQCLFSSGLENSSPDPNAK